MSPERDDYRDDDEQEEFASRSIFSAGWFSAVLVLTVLAIVVVISLPYLLNWFEPSPPARWRSRPSRSSRRRARHRRPPLRPPAPPAADRRRQVKPAPPAPRRRRRAAPPAAPAPAPKAVAEKASAGLVRAGPQGRPGEGAGKPRRRSAGEGAGKNRDRAPTGEARDGAREDRGQARGADRVVAKADAPSRPAAVASAKPLREAAPGTTGSSSAPSRSRRTPTRSPRRSATRASRSR